jgi:biotin transport system substrate-specific component
MQRQGTLTLSQALVPERTLVTDILLVLAGSAVVALFAQLTIPLVPVPITGQTFAVLLVGAVLGSKRGALSILAYIGEGLAGLPVYQGGNSAWAPNRFGEPYLLGSTAGYLVGFVLAAFVVGWLAERYGMSRNPLRMALLMLVGNVLIYVPGLIWLQLWLIGHEVPASVWQAGLIPFLPGDAVKLVGAAIVGPAGWELVRRMRPGDAATGPRD